MQWLNDETDSPQRPDEAPGNRAIRTYDQIARILIERGFRAITPDRVKRICDEAELRLGCLLLVDPWVRQHMRFTDAENERAIGRLREFVNRPHAIGPGKPGGRHMREEAGR